MPHFREALFVVTVCGVCLGSAGSAPAQETAQQVDAEPNIQLDAGTPFDFSTLDVGDVPLTDAEIELQNERFRSIYSAGLNSEEVSLPSSKQVVDAALLYRSEGARALLTLPYMAPFLSEDIVSGSERQCAARVALVLLKLARDVAKDESLYQTVAELISTNGDGAPSIGDVLGDDWELELPQDDAQPRGKAKGDFEVEIFELDEEQLINLEPGTQVLIDPSDPRDRAQPVDPRFLPRPITLADFKGFPDIRFKPLLKDRLDENGKIVRDAAGNPVKDLDRDVFKTACKHWSNLGSQYDNWGELTFTVRNEFKLHYRICGAQAIPEFQGRHPRTNTAIPENSTFLYTFADGTASVIKKCNKYSDSCAPTLIQMIAADLLYARRKWRREGFNLPRGLIAAGPATTPEIPVYVTVKREASTAHLGKIWLHQSRLYDRNLAFHEYFHLVEEAHGSILSLIGANVGPDFWRSPKHRTERDSFFWANLESLAEWSAQVLDHRHPRYLQGTVVDRLVDSHSYPFQQTYAPLIYGYMAERYKRHTPPDCVGCDAIRDYIVNYLQPASWKLPGLERYLASEKTSIDQLIDHFQHDLMLNIYGKSKGSHRLKVRLANRNAPSVASWSWPNFLRTIPTDAAPKNRWLSCFEPLKGVAEKYATPLPSDPQLRRQVKTCGWEMAASGAAYFRIELENAKLPKRIMLRATPRDDNNRLINDRLELTIIPVVNKGDGDTDFRELEALGYYPASGFAVEGFNSADQAAGVNELHLVVRYPESRTKRTSYKDWMFVFLRIEADWF